MRKLNNKGFTLIEIIVVLIIIGILAAVALPNLFQYVQASRGSAVMNSATSYKTVIEACMAKNSTPVNTVPCDMASLFGTMGAGGSIALPNKGEIDIVTVGGTVAGNDISYDMVGYDNAAAAFSLVRASNGVFTCTAGASPYNTVC